MESKKQVTIINMNPRSPNRPTASQGGSGILTSKETVFALQTTPHYVSDSPRSTSTPSKPTKNISPNIKAGEVQQTLTGKKFRLSTFLSEGFLAKLSLLLGNGEDLKIQGELSSLKSLGVLDIKDHHFVSLKTSKAYYPTMRGEHLVPSSQVFLNWGMISNGKCLTANISEFHKIGKGSSLSDILEDNPDKKYFLSEKSIQSIINRMHKGTTLHTPSNKETNTEGAI